MYFMKCQSRILDAFLFFFWGIFRCKYLAGTAVVFGRPEDMQSANKCLRDPVFYRCKVDVFGSRAAPSFPWDPSELLGGGNSIIFYVHPPPGEMIQFD